jgi:hypothetical protein
MAKFDLEKKVSKLEWNFGGGVRGITPEPSNHAVNTFQDAMANNLEAIGRPAISDRTDMNEIRKAYADLSVDEMDQLHEWSLDALVTLCQGSPSREQLDDIGHRGQQAFLGFIQEELVNPEGVRPATGNLRAV